MARISLIRPVKSAFRHGPLGRTIRAIQGKRAEPLPRFSGVRVFSKSSLRAVRKDGRQFLKDLPVKRWIYDYRGKKEPFTVSNPVDWMNMNEWERNDAMKEEIRKTLHRAYRSRLGYATTTINGEKVMVIKGTKGNPFAWAQNVADMHTHQIPLNLEALKANVAARYEKPDVVLGHSRGAAVAARMRYGKRSGKTKYVGLDGAMILTRGRERNMRNISQDHVADRLLGMYGRNNSYIPYKKKQDKFHFVTG